MANLRMILNDGHAGAVLTATSEETGQEIENTQHERRAKVWRSTDATAQTIAAVMPVSAQQGGIVLSNTNLTLDATVSADLKNGVTVIDTVTLTCLGVNLDGTTTWVAWFDLDEEADQYEMVITDAANPAGYLQVVQIVCGPTVTTQYNFAFGAEMAYIEDVNHRITAGLSVRSDGTGLVRREFSLDWQLLYDADRQLLVDELLRYGMREPLFLSLYPGRGGDLECRHQFVAKRMSSLNFRHDHPMLWSNPCTFREV